MKARKYSACGETSCHGLYVEQVQQSKPYKHADEPSRAQCPIVHLAYQHERPSQTGRIQKRQNAFYDQDERNSRQ